MARPTGSVPGGPTRTAVLEGGPCDGQRHEVEGPVPPETVEVTDVQGSAVYMRTWRLRPDLTEWTYVYGQGTDRNPNGHKLGFSVRT